MIPPSDIDRIERYIEWEQKYGSKCASESCWFGRTELSRLVAAYRELLEENERLRKAATPILQELRNREPFEETNPDWNLEAVIDCSVTVGEARALAVAMARVAEGGGP